MHSFTHRRMRGFSLIEMAMVLAMSGLMLGFVLQAQQSAGSPECYTISKAQMVTVKTAIEQFARKNDRLPMPAARNIGVEDVKYGREASGADIDANSGASFGALPFQALGLAPSYGVDCWGNKFTYVVTTALTTSAAPGGYLDTTVNGNISVSAGFTNAAYAIISHGEDGLGAVKANYSAANPAHGWCPAPHPRLDNTNCAGGTFGDGTPGNVVVDGIFNNGKNAANKYFDDIILVSGRPLVANRSNMWCWGTDNNAFGRLGDGNASAHSSYVPVRTSGGIVFTKFAKVGYSSVGLTSFCGLTADGTAYCWGNNSTYQIGDGTSTTRAQPTAVSTAIKFYSLYMFRDTGSTNAVSVCGLQRNADGTLEGTAYCWGANNHGGLGVGAATNPVTTPTAVAGGLKFLQITGGAAYNGNSSGVGYAVCGLTIGGDAYCWGEGAYARGGGTSANYVYTPEAVVGGHKFSTIGVFPPTCAITSAADAGGAGKLYCWGPDGRNKDTYGTYAVSGIAKGNPTVITTSVPHNLTTGDRFLMREVRGMGGINTNLSSTYMPAPYGTGTTLATSNGTDVFSVQAGNYTATTVKPYAYQWSAYLNTTSYPNYTSGGVLAPFMKASPVQVAASSGLTFAGLVDAISQDIVVTTDTGHVYTLGDNFGNQMGNGSPTWPGWNNWAVTFTNGTSSNVNKASHGVSTGDLIYAQPIPFSGGFIAATYLANTIDANNFTLKTMDNVDVDSSSFPAQNIWYVRLPLTGCSTYAYQGAPTYCYTTPAEPTGSFTVTDPANVVANIWNDAIITSGGPTKAWGSGNIGDGSTGSATPVNISPAYNFQKIYRASSTGSGNFCAIDTSNNAYCWGDTNTSGDFGNGGTAAALNPTAVSGGLKFTSLLNVGYPLSNAGTITCGITP